MRCSFVQFALLGTVAMGLLVGCHLRKSPDFSACSAGGFYEQVAAEIEYPAVTSCTESACCDSMASLKPWSLAKDETPEYWDVRLEEVIHLALANSQVLRDLGGAVVRAPGATRTKWDPAIQETDPRFGMDAALSAFDAEFNSNVFFDKNDRQLNNVFFGGGIRQLTQDLMNWDTEINKRAVTGTELAVRHHVDYDANNAPGNAFPSAFNAWVEGEFRHPLLQGGGTQFNRIAGPSQTPGIYNGVLIARLNTDVQITEFELAVRDLVSNLENAYWDLYFAYRDLDAKIAARDAALDTWRKIYALYESGRRGGEAEKEAQAREQFFRFQEEVQNALSGRLLDGTRTNNGSSGGTFRGAGGVYVTERRLRLLMGLPPNDGRLLRPADEPVVAQVAFDWDQVSHEAAARRAELRRQKWQIRRRELELIASKNHLLPRLDAVGRYRWRGFGKNLFGSADLPATSMIAPIGGASAYDQLMGGNFQEWQLGVELNVPIGFRQGHTAVRNAELMLARARALLCEQERDVVHQAAGAVAEVDRAYAVSQTAYNRLIAGNQQLQAVEARFEEDKVSLDLLLEAQRHLAEAESQYYRTLAEYAVAAKNVHYTKGTLLEYDSVYLAEGGWPAKAYHDAQELERRRGKSWPLNYASARAPVVSQGAFPQQRSGETVIDPGVEFHSEVGAETIVSPGSNTFDQPLPPPEAELPNPNMPRDAAPGGVAPSEAAPNGRAPNEMGPINTAPNGTAPMELGPNGTYGAVRWMEMEAVALESRQAGGESSLPESSLPESSLPGPSPPVRSLSNDLAFDLAESQRSAESRHASRRLPTTEP